jgi:hypothetical protein
MSFSSYFLIAKEFTGENQSSSSLEQCHLCPKFINGGDLPETYDKYIYIYIFE